MNKYLNPFYYLMLIFILLIIYPIFKIFEICILGMHEASKSMEKLK